MIRKFWIFLFCGLTSLGLTFPPAWAQGAKEKPAKEPAPAAVKSLDEGLCYGCHSEIQELKGKGQHAKGLNCAACHPDTSAHLSGSAKKPVTRLDPESCGSCHRDPYPTLMGVNLKSKAKLEKSTTILWESPRMTRAAWPPGSHSPPPVPGCEKRSWEG
jgi:hypothetical protein